MEQIIVDGLAFSLPLFIMAIGGIYSERSGVMNLCLEGFQGFGAFVGALSVSIVAHNTNCDMQHLFYLALLMAMVGGMIYSLLHALLCVKVLANQVISGVVMNILAAALTSFLTKVINRNVFGAESDKFDLGVAPKWTIPGLADIPVVGKIFTDLYPFEIIIIFLAIILGYIFYKTTFGIHLRACGDNPQAVDAAGINVAKIRTMAVMFSGALSGLAGISFAYSISAKFSSGIYLGYGYLALATMIFGNWKIMPTFFACIVFGFAKAFGYQLILWAGLPSSYSDLIMILPYALTLVLLVFFSKNNHAPRAVGEIYDKGKR